MQPEEQNRQELHDLIERKRNSPAFAAIVSNVNQTPTLRIARDIERMSFCASRSLKELETLMNQLGQIPECGQSVEMINTLKTAIDYLTLGKCELSRLNAGVAQ